MISKNQFSIGYNEISYKTSFLNYMVLYSFFIPFSQSILSIIQSFLIKIKFEKFYQQRDLYFKINNIKTLENLSMISYVLLDKTNTITNGNLLIKSIYIPNKLYLFEVEKTKLTPPKIIKTKFNEQLVKTNSIKLYESQPDIPNETKNFNEQNVIPDFFSNKIKNKKINVLPDKKPRLIEKFDKLVIELNSNKISPKKISFEIQLVDSKPNLKKSSNSFEIEEENEKQSAYNKNFLSPETRTNKKIGKDSISFTMKYSKYHFKTTQSIKNNAMPDFIECDDNDFNTDLSSDDTTINAIKSLILCHNAKTLTRDGSTLRFFHTNDDQEVMRFSSQIAFKFERICKFPNRLEYFININGLDVKYDVLGINYYSKKNDRSRFSIVLKEQEGKSDKAVLYAKGSYRHIINSLEMDDKRKSELLGLIQSENFKGRRAIIYAKRELDHMQTEEYKKNYDALHSNFSVEDNKLQEFYCQIEVKLNLLCIVFIEDCLRPHLSPTIKLFSDLGMKIWILTGDALERSLCTAFLSKVINSDDYLSFMKCSSLQEAQLSIKSNLRIINELIGLDNNENASPFLRKSFNSKSLNVFEKKKMCLFVDGNSLDFILNDENLSDHLCFILYFCKAFVGYRLTPFHKGVLAKKIKEKFINEPLVLAIGDGFNDNLMLEACDASIRFADKNFNNHKGDIFISGWDIIPSLIINSCILKKDLENSHQFLYSSFILFFFSTYFYSWYNNFNGSGLYKNGIIIYIFLIHSGFFSIFLSFFVLSKKENFTNVMKNEYKLESSNKSKILFKFIFFGFIVPLSLVLICFYLVLYTIYPFCDENGFETNLNTLQAAILLVFFALNTIRVKHFFN